MTATTITAPLILAEITLEPGVAEKLVAASEAGTSTIEQELSSPHGTISAIFTIRLMPAQVMPGTVFWDATFQRHGQEITAPGYAHSGIGARIFV